MILIENPKYEVGEIWFLTGSFCQEPIKILAIFASTKYKDLSFVIGQNLEDGTIYAYRWWVNQGPANCGTPRLDLLLEPGDLKNIE